MRVAHKGTRLSVEHKWKIGLGGLGRLFSEEHIYQYHPENGEANSPKQNIHLYLGVVFLAPKTEGQH